MKNTRRATVRTGTLASALILSAAFSSNAFAADDQGWYGAVTGGFQNRDTVTDEAGTAEFDTGFHLGGALGYRMGNFRFEGEVNYFDNDLDTLEPHDFWRQYIGNFPEGKLEAVGHVEGNNLFANLFYDIPISGSNWTPYVGAGLGARKVEIKGLSAVWFKQNNVPINDTASSGWDFAYQAMLGVNYRFMDDANLRLGYRYVDGDNLTFNMPSGNTITPHARFHMFDVGVRIDF
jgi:opacity protein-like surface antigen